MKNMKKSEFKRLLSRGYGNALRFLKYCDDPMKYAKIIAECCTADTCFDMQCEGDRGEYLCDAVMLTGQPEYFAEIVMKRLDRRLYDNWASLQMLSLLLCIYWEYLEDRAELSERIRAFLDELYTKEFNRRSGRAFVRNSKKDGFENLCIILFDMDESYFERIVNDVGGYLSDHPTTDRFSLDWFFSHSTDCGKKRGRLRKADKACAEHFIMKFGPGDREELPRPKRPTLTELINSPVGELSESDNLRRTVNYRLASHKADDEELLQCARAAVSAKDEGEKYRMLCVFEKKPFPLGFEAVREMYESGSEKIKEKCLEITGCFKERAAEDFARQIAEDNDLSDSLRCEALYAYVQAAERLDTAFIMDYAPDLPDVKPGEQSLWEHFHRLWHNFEYRRDKGSRKYEHLRRYFYNNLSCSFCREYLVELMVRSRDDCGDILAECRFDCSLSLRRYARRVMNRRQNKQVQNAKV